jgi:hypothetical protein
MQAGVVECLPLGGDESFREMSSSFANKRVASEERTAYDVPPIRLATVAIPPLPAGRLAAAQART